MKTSSQTDFQGPVRYFVPAFALELKHTIGALVFAALMLSSIAGGQGNPPSAPTGGPAEAAEIDLKSLGQPQPTPGPAEDFGSNDTFSFSHSSEDPEVAVVYPNSGGEPAVVSSTFLGMIMRNSRLSNTDKLRALQAYRAMTEQAVASMAAKSYPDKSVQTEPFPDSTLEAGDKTIVLSQDPLADPYVRVSVAGVDGKVEQEYSLTKNALEMLEKANLPPDKKAAALGEFPFRLPEEARNRFGDLNTTQIMDLAVESEPMVAKQEMLKMHKFFTRQTTDSLKQIAAKASVRAPKDNPGNQVDAGAADLRLSRGNRAADEDGQIANATRETPPATRSQASNLLLVAVFAGGVIGGFLLLKRFR